VAGAVTKHEIRIRFERKQSHKTRNVRVEEEVCRRGPQPAYRARALALVDVVSEAHTLEHLDVIVDLEWLVKVEEVFGLILGHLALDVGVLAGVDDDKGKVDAVARLHVGGRAHAVALDQILERDLLQN